MITFSRCLRPVDIFVAGRDANGCGGNTKNLAVHGKNEERKRREERRKTRAGGKGRESAREKIYENRKNGRHIIGMLDQENFLFFYTL
jgi:hypothetical protein